MRGSLLLSCFALLSACSSEPSSPAVTPDASSPDAPSVDAPATPDAPSPPRDGASASCGTAFGTRCNLITNEGCAAGQGCYLTNGVAGMTALCRPAGSGNWDDACQATTDCREGFLCVAPGRCARLCCSEDDTSCSDTSRGGRPGARCASALTDGRGLRLCVSDSGCDPFATSNNRCPMDQPRCNPTGDATTCGAFSRSCARPGGDGAPCCEGGCCQPGYLCVGATTADTCNPMMPGNACRRACNLQMTSPDSQCPMGQRCTAFSAMSGLPRSYGFCAPAM